MSYAIEGWVEVTWCQDAEQDEDYAWQSLINLGVLIQVSDAVSEQLFGLSRRCVSGDVETQPLAAHRGIPSNPSPQVQWEMEWIQKHEKQYGPGECGGYTYATWQEIKTIPVGDSAFAESDWRVVFDLVQRLEQSQRYADNQIRFVVWYSW